ncbi:hypothetical protein A3B45_03005 [Candidatus Daviesbacteria bacterium RIFCSPLOWO2_01_FULL_39_12]|uniref:Uncharacterized protein n=1 Tax=Candidatus Daviesbacteria bacterium RIFCSPLOWO2_01_FULL_39_12 TaxID=1797785 RepID=A0A1F5KTP5_9BACT|nr:MAG: hypothetical protein A3D79_01680 [Candidatus Daviesbacteria bacterium RIFCSPHIGHO2_02_FULL_39_8]OGE43991.1 MAG: hypothetical protein A3B45_03005 [Candidatus Daviesbacteria bacterium RIFCSPLOWO2_01_FULL_39_12]
MKELGARKLFYCGEDPVLAAIWKAYGPGNYPPNGYTHGLHPNPWEAVARVLHPEATPESVAEGWKRLRARAIEAKARNP